MGRSVSLESQTAGFVFKPLQAGQQEREKCRRHYCFQAESRGNGATIKQIQGLWSDVRLDYKNDSGKKKSEIKKGLKSLGLWKSSS